MLLTPKNTPQYKFVYTAVWLGLYCGLDDNALWCYFWLTHVAKETYFP